MDNIVTKKRLEKIKGLRLVDDDYAKMVFKDLECLSFVASTILHKKIEIVKHETEASLNIIKGRSIVCDILVLTNDESINLEMKKNVSRANAKRMRYHASVIDVSLSKPGVDFSELKDVIVIFVCDFDPLKKGYPLYHVKRYIDETKELFDDGIEIIMFNCLYDQDDEYGRLGHDMRCSNPNEMYNEVLKNRNKYFKETKEGRRIMCEAWEEERRAGILEGKIEAILSLMESVKCTLEEAMNMLKLSEEDRDICRKKIVL